MKRILSVNYVATGAAGQYRIATWGANDGEVAQASAANQPLIGVYDHSVEEAGQRADVMRIGMPDVEYGGVVAKGDQLTSDADGKAIKLTDSATQNRVGFAEVDAVDGDIGPMTLAQG